jgi:UrcA family protein
MEIAMIRSKFRTAGIVALAVELASFEATAESPAMTTTVDAHQRGADVEVRRKVVRFADLSLAREAGVKVLYRRLHAAAQEVCSPLSGSRDLTLQMQWRECRDTAVKDAIAEIDHPLLSEHHAQSTSDAPLRG